MTEKELFLFPSVVFVGLEMPAPRCGPRPRKKPRRFTNLKRAMEADAFLVQQVSGNSSEVARMFNVSPKTVRAIWNRRTWMRETKRLWTDQEGPMIRDVSGTAYSKIFTRRPIRFIGRKTYKSAAEVSNQTISLQISD